MKTNVSKWYVVCVVMTRNKIKISNWHVVVLMTWKLRTWSRGKQMRVIIFHRRPCLLAKTSFTKLGIIVLMAAKFGVRGWPSCSWQQPAKLGIIVVMVVSFGVRGGVGDLPIRVPLPQALGSCAAPTIVPESICAVCLPRLGFDTLVPWNVRLAA